MEDDKDIFPFFELSRELRDIVYSNLLVPEQKVVRKYDNDALHILRNGPQRSLLRLNRQFSEEYEKCVLENAVLAIMDTADFAPSVSPPLPKLLQQVKSTEITIMAYCSHCSYGVSFLPCGARGTLDCRFQWLEHIMPQLLKSKSIVVKIGLGGDRPRDSLVDAWNIYPEPTTIHRAALEQIKRIIEFPNLTLLALHKMETDYNFIDLTCTFEDAVNQDFSDTTLRATWTNEEGWKSPAGKTINMK